MRDKNRPAGLKLRGAIWHIDKVIRVGDQRHILRETTGASTIADARRILSRREAEIRAQLLGGPITAEHTWAEAAAEYVADLESRGKSSARTLQDIRLLLPAIGDMALSHVHQRTLQPWIDSQHGQRASGTVDRAIRTCSTVLHFAAQVLRDGNTPWLRIAPPKLRSPDWGARQPRPITWEEQDRLITELPDYLVGPVLFALATGARQGEITSLQWDAERTPTGLPRGAVWWIPPEIRKASSKRKASEQQGRYLVANRAARAVIDKQRGKDPTWVFPRAHLERDGSRLPIYRINGRIWRAAIARAGLAIRVHDLRHTFGERAADAGIPLDIRRSLLGHEHRDITLHYSSPGLARLLEEAERIVRPSLGELRAIG